ncbi:MAG TPA: tetratricopeptide repeat protein, partial [Terriglobales bacterium]|nr:tetratricopeptide repeat protein [Terriglobales bacterium]
PRPKIQSLAVLPLKNLSGDPTQEYFAEGMTEAIIGRLSMIRGLRVISRTSVMRFRDTRASVPEIAKTLGVDAVVEGSVIREGDHLRVHAQLIRGASDDHFWSETYDREIGDVLVLESEVAQAIAEKVEVTISGEERARLVAARPVSPEVYESFLKGEFTQNYDRADVAKAIAYFEDAIKKDPKFAPAYLGLADAYEQFGTAGIGGAAPGEVRPKAISAIHKALELDPNLSQAHTQLANAYRLEWKWSDSEAEYKRALELNPNDAGAHLGYAGWLICEGRADEALVWARRARELDPLGVTGGNSMGWILFITRHYDEAIRELKSDLAVHPDDGSTYWFLGFALIANAQAQEAIPVLEKAVALSDRSPAVIAVLIRVYAHAGRRAQALGLLAELQRRQKQGYVTPAAFVNAYLGLGDNEKALAALEQAYQDQSAILQFVRVHPFMDPVRNDPRFADLVRRVGLN